MRFNCLHLIYTTLITASLPTVFLRLLWKSRKNKDYRKRINERFSIRLPQSHDCIWIHAVSVGECLAAYPLMLKLLAQYPNKTLLITTTTPTGSAIIKEKLGNRVNHCYLPFDAPFLVKKFLRQTRPQVAIFIETEIWPNFIHQLKKREIPTVLINARLSQRSFLGYQKLGRFSQAILSSFSEIACQDKASEKRFKALGANASTLGNIKFDINMPTDLIDKKETIKQRLNLIENPQKLILAASTHKGEDALIVDAYKKQKFVEKPLLVIAPRHPERSASILNLVKTAGLIGRYYSATKNKTTLPDDTDVLIIDSLGELLYFYALADYAIIGGSFVEHGGHNPLEPALFGTPCLMGEHYFNFEELVNNMLKNEAIIISSASQLFEPRPELKIVGDNAKALLHKNQGALENYQHLITSHIKRVGV